MHQFDSTALRKKLEALPHTARVAFALACAERLVSSRWEPIAPAQAARSIAHQFVHGIPVNPSELVRLALQVESSAKLDRDDVAACAFVLDCVRTGDAQFAVWAAQRAYEARDLAAQEEMDFAVYTPEIEIVLLAHPAVQAELASQKADIADLVKDPDTAQQIANRAVGGHHA